MQHLKKKIFLIILSFFIITNLVAGEKEPGFFPIPSDVLNDIKGNLDRIRQENPKKNILLYLASLFRCLLLSIQMAKRPLF